ncbi:MAG: DUF2306 domain-containing protein [Aureispira sp.]
MKQVIMRVRQLLWLFFVFFWLGIAIIIAWSSWRHFAPWEAPSIFLQDKQDAYFYFLPALYAHVFSSPMVLLLGSCCLWPALRRYSIRLHQWLGKAYVGLLLLLAAPSGFVMAFWALGGWAGQLCFVILSLLWMGVTWLAWKAAIGGNYAQHRVWMWRSFALTTAAFFLRFFSFLGAYFWHWRGPDVYIGLAWASWLFPLLVVELFLQVSKRLG